MLKLIRPSEHLIEHISVRFPLRETMPPYGLTPERKLIDVGKIRVIKFVVGILPADESVSELLQGNIVGPYVNEVQFIHGGKLKGKTLLELQTLIESDPVKRPGIETPPSTTS